MYSGVFVRIFSKLFLKLLQCDLMLCLAFFGFGVRCKHAGGLLHTGDPLAVDMAPYTPIRGRLSFKVIIGVTLFE